MFNPLLCFSKSLYSISNTNDHVKCISLNNQQWMTQPTLINLHPNENIEELCYNSFAVTLYRYMENWNALSDLPNKICVPKK